MRRVADFDLRSQYSYTRATVTTVNACVCHVCVTCMCAHDEMHIAAHSFRSEHDACLYVLGDSLWIQLPILVSYVNKND